MPTRDDLEQEIAILESEAEAKDKQLYEMRLELDQLRGAAEKAGVSLVVATPLEQEKQALDHVRAGINSDLQALDELRNPPQIADGKPESNLDIVRANQRERADLQATVARGNNTLSRIAAALKLEKWNDETSAGKLVDRVNYFAALELRVSRKIKELRKKLDQRAGGTDDTYEAVWVSALEWVLSTLKTERPALNTKAPRLINFVVNGHDTPVEAKPDQSLRYLLELALVRASLSTPPDQWLLYAEDGARLSPSMIASELQASRVVATLPIGVGA
jgi:hypothetical protein